MNEVVLRDERGAGGSRWLAARIDDAGDLVVEGQDLGDEVERAFGAVEYEWSRRVRAPNLTQVLEAFGVPDAAALLAALRERFSGEHAAGLDAALDACDAPVEKWSRIGD